MHVMEINIRSFLLVLLFYGLEDSLALDVVTYATKQEEELKCSFTTTAQWSELQDGGRIIRLFSYNSATASAVRETNDTKYNNFNFSIKGTDELVLLITNVDEQDGGQYLCTAFPATVTFVVIVEVLPASISINCTELNLYKLPGETTKASAHHISCTCVATGVSSKTVDIEWKGTSTPTTSNTTRSMNNATGTFTIRSEITLPSPDWNSSVSCSLTGFQSQIPERLKSFNYTFLSPVCTLMHECSLVNKTALLTCNCRGGFPEVDTFWFYDSKKSVIATQSSNKRQVGVEPNMEQTFYCGGSNEVDQLVDLEFRCQQAVTAVTFWWIFITIGLIAIIVVIAVWYMRNKVRKKRSRTKSDERRVESDPERGNLIHQGREGKNDEDEFNVDPLKVHFGKGKESQPEGTGSAKGRSDTGSTHRQHGECTMPVYDNIKKIDQEEKVSDGKRPPLEGKESPDVSQPEEGEDGDSQRTAQQNQEMEDNSKIKEESKRNDEHIGRNMRNSDMPRSGIVVDTIMNIVNPTWM